MHCRIERHLGRRLHPITQVICEYFLCGHLTGTPDNRDPVENLTVTWVEDGKLTRFIPAQAIFPPVLELLAETK